MKWSTGLAEVRENLVSRHYSRKAVDQKKTEQHLQQSVPEKQRYIFIADPADVIEAPGQTSRSGNSKHHDKSKCELPIEHTGHIDHGSVGILSRAQTALPVAPEIASNSCHEADSGKNEQQRRGNPALAWFRQQAVGSHERDTTGQNKPR